MFVVKANAYGHGAVLCAKAAERARAVDCLGVSSVEEGLALREAGARLPILVLGSLYPFESFLAAAEGGLTPTVASLESARRLVQVAAKLERPVACHLKVETGMGRIGVSPLAAVEVARYLLSEKGVRLEGVYTHLACAEDDADYTREQLARFRKACADIVALCGRRVPMLHAANSAAALRHPVSRLDMVRAGGALYGLCEGFAPVLSLKSRLVFIKTVPKGTAIGYGAAFRARAAMRVGTLPVGYADGLSRALSNKGHALVGGRRCPIVGRLAMDMLMLDLTRVPSAKVGDEAVLIGRQGREEISSVEIAEALGTIPYEVACAISTRVPRLAV